MQKKPMTPEEQEAWIQRFYKKAAEYLATKGVIAESYVLPESRYLIPLLVVWKINAQDKQTYWVITGEVPTDHLPLKGAADAREAIRAFSLRWQMQAENLLRAPNKTEEQEKFAYLLIDRANGIYDLFNDDSLWGNPN